jgi:hypothetical protein
VTIDYPLACLKRAAENEYPWSVTPGEAAALVAEVERLREGEARRLQLLDDAGGLENERDALAREVAFLRACVPPTHPSHYGYEAWEERLRAEVERERAAVVAWLRDGLGGEQGRVEYADDIERGEHRREDENRCPYCGALGEPNGCADCAAEAYERGTELCEEEP